MISEKIRLRLDPPEDLTVSQWAEKNRVLVGASSAEPGPWRNSRTPFLTGIMDAFSNRSVERLVLCKGSQLGGSEVLFNLIGFIIDQDPAPTLVVYPTIDLARSVSAGRIQPMIDASPTLRAKKPPSQDDFALQEMRFPGMTLFLSGANSPASLASRPCRFIFLDEVDKFPSFAGKEADPVSLAEERQKTFWNRKTVIISTPTIEGGAITRELRRCDEVRRFHVPCPFCGITRELKMDGIKWPKELNREDPHFPLKVRDSAWYECPECREKIDDLHRPTMIGAGHWVAEKPAPFPRSVGFVISSLCSPWLRWGDIAEAFVRSKDFPEKLMNFVNSWLAEVWKQEVINKNEIEILKSRADIPRQVVPEKAVCLTAAIDVQKVGFWYGVRAWAQDYTSWLIDYGFLPTWEQVEALLFGNPPPYGAPIWRALIDIGGGLRADSELTSTEETILWIRANMRRGVQLWGAKGASHPLPGKLRIGKPLDTTPGGKSIKGWGIQIITLDTDKLKSVFHWRLDRAKTREIGAAYLHQDTNDDYARQITAETLRKARDGSEEWVRTRPDNHFLDCEVMNLAAADPELFGGIRFSRGIRPKEPPPQKPEAPKAPQKKEPEENPYLSGGFTGNPYTS